MDFFFLDQRSFLFGGRFFYYFCRETQKEGILPPADLGGSLGRLIYIRERGIFWDGFFQEIVLRKSKEKREKSKSSRVHPGMFLVTLEILTHIRFLRIFVFGIFNILFVGVDVKGHKLFCWAWLFTSLFNSDFDYFTCHECLRKYTTPFLNVIMLFFLFESYLVLFPLLCS